MKDIVVLKKLGFLFKSSYADETEGIGYSYFEHKDEDLKCVHLEVNYADNKLADVQSIDVIVPSFIITNPSTERIEKILSLLRPCIGEIITILK